MEGYLRTEKKSDEEDSKIYGRARKEIIDNFREHFETITDDIEQSITSKIPLSFRNNWNLTEIAQKQAFSKEQARKRKKWIAQIRTKISHLDEILDELD